MRTQEEIVAWLVEEEKTEDLFGFCRQVIVPYLPYSAAKVYLKPEITETEWLGEVRPFTQDRVMADMREYMAFAWDKVADHRGLSAVRSVSEMKAWCYILGEDELVAFCDEVANYAQYGAPILKHICEKLGFPIPDDPGVLRMCEGLPCHPGCEDGCCE